MFVEGFRSGSREGGGGTPRPACSPLFSPPPRLSALNTAPSVTRSTWAWRGTPGNAYRRCLMSRRFSNGGVAEKELAEL